MFKEMVHVKMPNWKKYQKANKEIKQAASEARILDFDGLYQSLGVKVGAISIYRLAKGRERKVKCVKDEGKVLVQERDRKYRWKTYLLN